MLYLLPMVFYQHWEEGNVVSMDIYFKKRSTKFNLLIPFYQL